MFSWSQPGLWDDQPSSYPKRFIVEVTTYENIPPSEFSLIAPEDNATFALTDDLDILVDLRWQASQDPDSDVNYFVNLHGSAVVGGETVTWKTSMSELTNQNEPMVNVRFDDNQDVWNQGWSSCHLIFRIWVLLRMKTEISMHLSPNQTMKAIPTII